MLSKQYRFPKTRVVTRWLARLARLAMLVVCIATLGGRGTAMPAVSMPVTLTTVSTDSVLPGYVRYQSPGQCDRAARRMAQFAWRDKRPDTLVFDPSRTTLSPSGLDSVRQCAARFDVAKLPAAQLASMLSLAIWAQEPTLITQVMHRLRQPMPSISPEMHAIIVRRAAEAFLTARPANVDSAVALRELLRPLEPMAGIYDLLLTNEITDFAMHLQRGDVANTVARAGVALLQPGRMTADDRTDYVIPLITAELYTIQLASRRPEITRQALYAMFDSAVTAVKHVSGASPDEIQGRFLQKRAPYEIFEQPTVPVHATYLYGDTTAPSLPRPGIVTLVYSGSMAGQSEAMPSNAVLRRLHAQFAAQGFAEIYLTATNGYFMNQLLPQPSKEAELTRKYFLEYEALPVTLVIERSYTNTNATGLIKRETPSNQANYPVYNEYVNCEVIGKDGKVKFFGWLTPETERLFAAAIRDALAEHVTSADVTHAN
jgi:hypothetical protein